MKAAQLSALVLGVSLALAALAASATTASAQASSDYPTGYGRTMSVVGAPTTDGLSSLTPSQQLAWLVGLRFAPANGGSSVRASAKYGQYRPAGGSGERRQPLILTNRSSVRPVGR